MVSTWLPALYLFRNPGVLSFLSCYVLGNLINYVVEDFLYDATDTLILLIPVFELQKMRQLSASIIFFFSKHQGDI